MTPEQYDQLFNEIRNNYGIITGKICNTVIYFSGTYDARTDIYHMINIDGVIFRYYESNVIPGSKLAEGANFPREHHEKFFDWIMRYLLWRKSRLYSSS